MKKYLFICWGGEIRSPTATSVAKDIAKRNGIQIETNIGAMCVIHSLGYLKSLGEELNSYCKIIVMEPNMAEDLINRCGVNKEKVYCINVYEVGREKNNPNLREELRIKLEKLID